MIERTVALSVVALMAATQVLAQEFLYLSDPGLCDAPDGVTELLDTTFLTAHSIGNHYFDCRWDEDLAAVVAAGNWAEVTATCESSSESWTQKYGFYPQDESNLDYPLPYPIYLSVWFDAKGLMPVKFYACDALSNPDTSPNQTKLD